MCKYCERGKDFGTGLVSVFVRPGYLDINVYSDASVSGKIVSKAVGVDIPISYCPFCGREIEPEDIL